MISPPRCSDRPTELDYIDLSAERIRTILESLKIPLTCPECKQAITQRVSEIVMKWSITPVGFAPLIEVLLDSTNIPFLTSEQYCGIQMDTKRWLFQGRNIEKDLALF